MNEIPRGLLFVESERRVPWGWILFFGVAVAGGLIVSVGVVQILYSFKIAKSLLAVRPAPVAIILGASVKPDGTPSDALKDRVLTGVDLYKSGKVDILLMSGDDGKRYTDEVSVMKRTAIEAGVPERAIVVDGHGYRTFESCKRAIETYYYSDAIVVTQRFHLGRALFLCNELGIDATGMVADRQTYVKSSWFWIRDLVSSVKAFWDVYGNRPKSPVPETASEGI